MKREGVGSVLKPKYPTDPPAQNRSDPGPPSAPEDVASLSPQEVPTSRSDADMVAVGHAEGASSADQARDDPDTVATANQAASSGQAEGAPMAAEEIGDTTRRSDIICPIYRVSQLRHRIERS